MSNIKFGTDGWRAIIAEDFTFANVELVTKAIAGYIKTKYDPSLPVIIGYDTRFMADKFAQRAADTLNKAGINVKLCESDAPTPVVAYSAKNLKTAGAIMLTASHNPPEYCGIKYIPDYAGPATKEITDIIVDNVNKLQAEEKIFETKTESAGITEKFDPKPEYFKWVKGLIDFGRIKKANINVFYDPIYSTGRNYFDGLLKEEGCNVSTLHDWIDPLYGGGMPEPREKFLAELKERVLNNYPSLGFSTDGDADRFGVIDEKGNFVSPNEVIAVVFRHLLKNKGRKGSVVKNVGTSFMIDKLAEKYGVTVHEVPVGFKWICEVMRREEVIVGGEESGGLSIWGHIPEKDGIVADLTVLEAVAYEGKPLFEIIMEMKEDAGVDYLNERIDIHLTEDKKEEVLKMFQDNPPTEAGGMKVKSIKAIDGIKLYFDDNTSWILIRPSGTEPLFRISFETDSKEKLEKLQADIKKVIELETD